MTLPMQPVERDARGKVRFRANAAVRWLLEHAGKAGLEPLNDMACADIPQADMEQFAQLIGYSVCGYHELSYVSDEAASAASRAAAEATGAAGPFGCRDTGCGLHCGVAKEAEG